MAGFGPHGSATTVGVLRFCWRGFSRLHRKLAMPHPAIPWPDARRPNCARHVTGKRAYRRCPVYLACGTDGSVHPMATGVLPLRQARESADEPGDGGPYGRGRAQPWRLLRKLAAQRRTGGGRGECGVEGKRAGDRPAAPLLRLSHGDFRGKQAAASIANQREEYIAKSLADYRSAARPSVGVAAMTEAAAGLSDDDIAALAHYLATL